MKRLRGVVAALCVALLMLPASAFAQTAGDESIIVATGEDVPINDQVPEDYRFPAEYQQDAVQFRTEDGVLLCGWVLGEGTRGITLGHANGWGTTSWLPFGERLVEAGYMVIIWEFRNIYPSGDAPAGADQRWDLDVLAAAQVLRERGATEILAMGASDGGNATAVAAPSIPELVGLGILSSPARSKGDGPAALARITVPAFFAVSNNDPGTGGGDTFLGEVQQLYDACASEQKELHVLTSYEHGTDLLSDVDVSSALVGSTEEQKQERRQLADDLMNFVNNTFGVAQSGGASGSAGSGAASAAQTPTEDAALSTDLEDADAASQSDPLPMVLGIAAGVVIIALAVLIVVRRRRAQSMRHIRSRYNRLR